MSQLIKIEDAVKGAMMEAYKVNVFSASKLDAEKNFAIQLLYKNELATKTAQNNPVSVQNAIINLAAIGISLNPATKHAYLVPRDNAICLDISYMGLMHLAQEIGSIMWGQAKVVYANDSYENQGVDKAPLHKFNSFGDRGQKIGVYCTVKLPCGDYLTEEMSAEQIEQVRNTSKSKNSSYSPWNTFEEEMWRKTVVKRASKYWPKSSSRLDAAIHTLNEHEGIVESVISDEWLSVKDKMLSLAESGTDIELSGFIDAHMVDFSEPNNNELVNWLHSQWPKGSKTRNAARIREGRNQINLYIDIFKRNEESEIKESLEEMSDLEVRVVLKEMTRRSLDTQMVKDYYIELKQA